MIQEVVLAHRPHVGDQALARPHAELPQRRSLPLGRGLHDLGFERMLVVVVCDMELDRTARTVTIQVVVDPALGVDDQRDLDLDQVELLAEVVLDVPLHGRDGALCVSGPEQRAVVRGQDPFEVSVVPDARSGQVRLLAQYRAHD